MCFNDAPYRPKDVVESKQATRVLEFREEIRGLELAYEGADDFRDKIRDYLEKYLKAHHPVAPGKVKTAIVGDPARYIKALRDETSHFDVQGLKFGDNRAYRFSIEEFYIPLTTSSGAGADTAKHGEMRATSISAAGSPAGASQTAGGGRSRFREEHFPEARRIPVVQRGLGGSPSSNGSRASPCPH